MRCFKVDEPAKLPGIDQTDELLQREQDYGNNIRFVTDESKSSLFWLSVDQRVTILNCTQIDYKNLLIEIENNTNSVLQTLIPAGTMVLSVNKNTQNTLITYKKQSSSQSYQAKNGDIHIKIPPKKKITIILQTACANLSKNSPNNQLYFLTKYKDPEINNEMTQQQIWSLIEKRVRKNAQQKKKIYSNIKQTSVKLFQMIQNKTLKLLNVDIDNGHIIMEIQSPVAKDLGLDQFSQSLSRKEAVKLSSKLEGEVVFGKTKLQGDSKSLKMYFPMSSQDVDANYKSDIIFKKDGIKGLVNDW